MGKNWAICIGINEYYNLKPLEYAKRDAESMRDFFLQEAQFEAVYYFSDDSPPIPADRGAMRSLPTFANLKRFLRERFQQPFLQVGDNFWFFFAGHGEQHEGHDYLMPIDVDPGAIEETAIRISDLTTMLRNCGADNVVLLLDACRSQGRRQGVGFGTEAEQQGVITVYSCSPRESSYEIAELQHGSFTYALLEGMRIQGASNCATVERLDQYLRYQVPELNRRHQKPLQTPYTSIEPIAKRHLILLSQQPALLADVLALKNDAQEAELEGALDFAEQLWIRVLAVSPADQQAIKGIQRIVLRRANQPIAPSQTTASGDSSTGRRADSSGSAGVTPSVPTFEFEYVMVTERGEIRERRQGRAECRTEELGDGVMLELVKIPEGKFLMGTPEGETGRSSDEGPQHEVKVRSFLMGKYAVTQAQWRSVAALPKVDCDLEVDPSNFKGDDRPVEQVSWHEAIEFCKRLSEKTGRDYRLPSEAEWEYACRAGTKTPFHFGETITTDLANYQGTDWEYKGTTYPGFYGKGPHGSYREQTIDVGSFSPNAFGLYDMHGNVWEWCLDHWHESYQGAPTDGSAWISKGDDRYRLLRGGSWFNLPDVCRSADRRRDVPDYRNDLLGFRVVCSSAWTL